MRLCAANGFAMFLEECGSLKHCMHLRAAVLCLFFSFFGKPR